MWNFDNLVGQECGHFPFCRFFPFFYSIFKCANSLAFFDFRFMPADRIPAGRVPQGKQRWDGFPFLRFSCILRKSALVVIAEPGISERRPPSP